jgi:hypothetical protein
MLGDNLSTYDVLSPPLWGRIGEGGYSVSLIWGLPPPFLALPHKGGGNAEVIPETAWSHAN